MIRKISTKLKAKSGRGLFFARMRAITEQTGSDGVLSVDGQESTKITH